MADQLPLPYHTLTIEAITRVTDNGKVIGRPLPVIQSGSESEKRSDTE
jgi:hypothetical protein